MRKNRVLILALALVLLFGVSVGGTLAWLLDKTDPVVNTFTDSDINITLTETDADGDQDANKNGYQMIPGWTIDKDPIVTVKAGSEDCWVFIKVEETGGNVTVGNKTYGFDDFIDYEIDPNNWEQLKDAAGNLVPGVYVQTMPSKNITADRAIKVLLNNQVTVKDTVTKEMMNALNETGATMPTLTFTAYASQLMKNNDTEFTAYEAWVNVSTATP